MFVKLLPNQIPSVWEQIKFTVTKASDLSGDSLRRYLNVLLHSLLNSKSCCFVRANSDRKLLAIIIVKIVIEEYTGDKSLLIENLYSFQSVDWSEWLDNFNTVKQLAVKENCKRIIAHSRNPAVFDLATRLGFEETERSFSLYIGE